tara:strand:+ start:5199 stop:13643 length:8445 start_codon:yes stop_codon:yes gene_type:complete
MVDATDFKQVCDINGSTEGPFKHILFLGLSVQSVTASMGWNSQQSTVTINLVEDDCPPPDGEFKYYYPRPGIEKRWGEADPGWTNPTIGAPCYFRLGDFEFAGLLQNWEKKHGSGGFTYTVTLCDPRLLLENVSVIISDYADSIDGGMSSTDTAAVENIVNAYGWAESKGFNCDQVLIKGASFGSPAGGFGGSLNNNEGTPYNIIKSAVMFLLSQTTPVRENVAGIIKTFSAGSARFRGHNTTLFTSAGGVGALDPDSFDPRLISQFGHNGYISRYFVDISEIPFAPQYFRLAGPQDTLMNIIANACSLSGCDFFVELIISGNDKIIKVKTTQRRVQPSLGEIEAFVATTDGVTEKNVGRELRNETNSSFLYGGYIQSIYEDLAENPVAGTDIIQHWGFDASGNFTPAALDADNEWDVTIDLRPLVMGLKTPLTDGATLAKKVVVSEREMRCALGEYDTWRNYVLAFNNKAGTPLGILIRATFPGAKLDLNPAPFKALANPVDAGGLGNDGAAGVLANDPANQKLTTEDTDDLKKIHKFVADFADEYYGKQFLVRLPFVCYRDDEESGQRMLSDNPTNDGGWPASVELEDENDPTSPMVVKTGILGLAWPPTTALPEMETFRDDVGKVHSFVRFDAAPTGAYPQNHENFVVLDSGLYMKGQLDEKVYEYTDGNACAVVKLNQAVAPNKNEEGVDKRFAGFLEIGDAIAANPVDKAKVKNAIKFLADDDQAGIRGDTALAMETKRLVPSGAAIPMISNTDRYGPYYLEGPPGQVKFESVEGLTPWNYNGYTAMDAAGAELVKDSVTFMQVGEKGSLTIPGFPSMRLGQELRDTRLVNPNFSFGMFGNMVLRENDELLVNGQTYAFNYLQTTPMDGTFGPNITDISVSMGTNGVTTSYTFRTFSPTFGKFAKYNAGQLQKVSKRRQEIARRNRLDDKINKRLVKAEERVNKALANIKRDNDAKNVGPGAPVVINCQQHVPGFDTMPDGQLCSDDVFRDMSTCEAATSTARQMTNCPPDPSGAFMSWDGLLYPVSKEGDGGLSPYVTPTGTCADLPGTTYQMDPPITGYTEPIINTSYLDPFASPGTPKHEKDPALVNHSSNHNHTRRLAHSDYSATNGTQTNMRVRESEAESFPEDFRFLGLKGPLLIHGWGYDLEGKPIPNYKDTTADASQGIFHNGPEELEDSFLPMWLRKPQTWPTAPLDVRFDRARGVWTVPNDFRIMQAKVVQSGGISAGETGSIQILNLRPTYDHLGVLITDEARKRGILSNPATIDCIGTLASGDTFFTFYDTIDCLYYPIPCSSGDSGCTVIYNSGCDNQCTGDAGAELDCVGTKYEPYVYVYGTGITASFVQLSGLTGCEGCDTGNITGSMTTDEGTVAALTGIMINLDLKASDSGYCDWSGAYGEELLDCYNFDHVIFGTGLQAISGQRECEVIVNADHYIYDYSYCDHSGISGATAHVLAGGFFNNLIAGTGLKVIGSGAGGGSGSSGCSYFIHADHSVKSATDTGCLTGAPAGLTLEYEFFNKLAFRSGLTVAKRSGEYCEYYVDSIPQKIADSGYCDYTGISVSLTGCQPFNCITFRSGIKVIGDPGDCDFVIDADHTLSKIRCEGDVETIEPTFFNHLAFYTGIDVELDNNCNYFISSALTLVDIEPTGDCTGTVPTVTEPVKYEALRFGSGLTVTGEGCEYTIHARQPCIADSGYCDWSPTVPDCEVFDELNAGSGLKVYKVGDCQYQIEADHYINDTSYCDWTATVENKFFTKLNIGTGLKVNAQAGDGCQYNIDADHYLKGTDYCDHIQEVPTYEFFNRLNFTRGLQVTSDGDCEYTIKADHYLSKIDCDDVETLAGTFFNMLTFYTGIDVEHFGDCEYGISSALKVQDIAYCDWTPVAAATPKKYENLYFGTGLKMFAYGDCGYSIDADHYLKGTDYCDHTQGVLTYEFFNKLNFDRGLQVTSDGDCEYTIKADHYIKDLDYCNWTASVGQAPNASPQFFTNLELGTGLRGYFGGDLCTVKIDADHYITDTSYCDHTATITDDFFTNLKFGTGLKVIDDGNCEFTIDADHRISDSSYCDWTRTVDDEFFNNLNFGTGLKVNKEGDGCKYNIDADHYLTDTDPCGGTVPAIANEFFTHLVFNTGLTVEAVPGSNCKYYINTNIKVSDNSYCDWTPTVTGCKERFECLTFGTGLQVYAVDGGACEYRIEADHYITDTSYCDHTATITDDFFTNLKFGTGLKVVDEGNCEFAINADHYITSTGSYHKGDGLCTDNDAVTKQFFNHLMLGSGLGLKDRGDCAYELFACGSGGSVQVKDSGYCDWAPTVATNCTDVSCITYGTGLKLISLVGGNAMVEADHYIKDTSGCGRGSNVVEYSFFNKVNFDSGLYLVDDGDCEYSVRADHHITDSGYCDHTATVEDEFFRLLTFRSGLKVNEQEGGNCEYTIDADHYITDSGYCDHVPSVDGAKFFNNLIAGTGLKVISSGDCAYRIDADHHIHDSAYCDHTPTIDGMKFFNSLDAGTGLKVVHSGDCTYRIDADHYLSSTDTDCAGTESYDHVFFNHLKFAEGIGVQKKDDCEYEIYACGNVKVKDSNSCSPLSYTPVVTDCSGLTCLEFGSGLHIYDSDLQPKVMATRYVVDVLDTGSCKDSSYNTGKAWYETLHFRSGIHVKQSGSSCEYIVDAIPTRYKGSATCSNFVAALSPPADQPLDSVFAGPGISIRQDTSDDCGYAIGTEFWFNSCSGGFNRPINKFEYGCGIVAVETPGDSCSVDISLDPLCGGGPLFGGLATGVSVVRDVCCTGDSLTINYVTLRFSSCGLFTGITQDDGLCDCCE